MDFPEIQREYDIESKDLHDTLKYSSLVGRGLIDSGNNDFRFNSLSSNFNRIDNFYTLRLRN